MLARAPSRQTVTVSTMASFAASWLVPGWRVFARDTQYRVAGRGLVVVVDLRRDRVDVALRHSGVIPVCMRCG